VVQIYFHRKIEDIHFKVKSIFDYIEFGIGENHYFIFLIHYILCSQQFLNNVEK
jgi:hypothetical protein